MNAKYRIKYKYSINIDKTQFKMPHDAKMIQYHTAAAVTNVIFIQS